jgi:hypothetical protein
MQKKIYIRYMKDLEMYIQNLFKNKKNLNNNQNISMIIN